MTLHILPTGAVQATVSHRFTEATLANVAQRVTHIGPGLARAHYAFRDLSCQTTASGEFRVTMTMQLRMEMPQWPGKTRRPTAEQQEWERFLRALRHHEDGHHTICRREARNLYRKLLASSSATFQSVFDREFARIERLHREYDHRTDHGVRQTGPHGNTVIQVP